MRLECPLSLAESLGRLVHLRLRFCGGKWMRAIVRTVTHFSSKYVVKYNISEFIVYKDLKISNNLRINKLLQLSFRSKYKFTKLNESTTLHSWNLNKEISAERTPLHLVAAQIHKQCSALCQPDRPREERGVLFVGAGVKEVGRGRLHAIGRHFRDVRSEELARDRHHLQNVLYRETSRD